MMSLLKYSEASFTQIREGVVGKGVRLEWKVSDVQGVCGVGFGE